MSTRSTTELRCRANSESETGSASGSSRRELDPELGEHLAQVPLHGARAEEQPRADLRVRQPVAGQPRDLPLLRGQLVARLDPALAHLLAGGQQLATGALGERLHPHLGEHPVRRPQLRARVDAPTLAAQPLAVEQVRAGVLAAHARAARAARSPRGRGPRRRRPRSAAPATGPRCRAPSRCHRHASSRRALRARRAASSAWPLRAAASISSGSTQLNVSVQPLGGFDHLLGRGQGALVAGRARCGAARSPTARCPAQAATLAARHHLLDGRLDQRRRASASRPRQAARTRAPKGASSAPGRLGDDLAPRRSSEAAAGRSPAKICATTMR